MSTFKIKKFDFQLILLSLLPIAFVVGPLIVEILVNILILIFLYSSVKNKDFYFLKNKIFIFFFTFYVFLIINLLSSDLYSETALNVFSYIRFFLFPFAIFEILKKNKNNLKFVFIILLITIFVVVLDGYYQFVFDKNFFGYEKYRIDRISGFFKDDLILGSYLSRLLPLFIGLIIFFKNDIKLTWFSLLIFFITYILIFLTGERASFLTASLTLLIILIQIRTFFYFRIIMSIASVSVLTFLMLYNPTMLDRHFTQMKNHILSYSESSTILPYYMPMFQTSLKMFNDQKLFGYGPKSYRYYCDKEKFVSYFPQPIKLENTIVKMPYNWKEKNYMVISEFFIREGDIIEKGDRILSYRYIGNKDLKVLFSNKEGRISKIINQSRYMNGETVMKIIPQYSPNSELVRKNACNTHPHNFYLQLLAETGFVGFIFIFSLFIYLLYLLIIRKRSYCDSEICILAGFFVVLWPITTNGNFFNNWINLISFYPLGFLLHIMNEKIKEGKKIV